MVTKEMTDREFANVTHCWYDSGKWTAKMQEVLGEESGPPHLILHMIDGGKRELWGDAATAAWARLPEALRRNAERGDGRAVSEP